MGAVVVLDGLLAARRVWRGRPVGPPVSAPEPTGYAPLDQVLPAGGWPEHALSEVLVPVDGAGELSLVWPTLARLTRAGERVALIAPPYRPHAPAWHSAGLDLRQVLVIEAAPRDALWAAEQCLRSAACKAVLCWPQKVDDRSLRRLATAAADGQCLGIVFRPLREAANPSPAALRLQLDASDRSVRVLKCRGGTPPARPIALVNLSR
jgi:cell division inhibitor SulA